MIRLLVKKFIPDYGNTTDNAVRERYGVLGGVLGICGNIFLFALKLFIGAASGSIAIISDSFNNLSDCGSSLVSIFGAKLSNRRPDREHPFGHGRSEYIAALIVSFITMMLGIELLRSSVAKIISPAAPDLSLIMIIILSLSLLVKVWLYSCNAYLGRSIESSVLLAAAKDSLSDVISTGAVILTAVIGKFIAFPQLDGIVGTVVSLLIIKTGFGVAAETIGLLLGRPPSPETARAVKEAVLSGECIVGAHDLIIHDYGPGRAMGSIHAEVPDNYDIIHIHEIIDELENEIFAKTGIHMVIHMDPVAVDCERSDTVKAQILEILHDYDSRLNLHDFRIVDGENRINLIFDLEVPHELAVRDSEIAANIASLISAADTRYNAVIGVDTVYD